MISVICCTIREDMMENVFQNYESQDIKKQELIIILNRKDMNFDKWNNRAKLSQNAAVYQNKKEMTLGESLNFGIQLSKYDYIAKMDDDDYYAPKYLSKQLKFLQDNNADVVCKRTVYMYFQQTKTLAIHFPSRGVNMFIQEEGDIKGATLVFSKKICKKVNFLHLNKNEDIFFIKKCIEKKFKVYVTGPDDYVCLRRSESLHTWNAPNQKLLKKSKILCQTDDYIEYLKTK